MHLPVMAAKFSNNPIRCFIVAAFVVIVVVVVVMFAAACFQCGICRVVVGYSSIKSFSYKRSINTSTRASFPNILCLYN